MEIGDIWSPRYTWFTIGGLIKNPVRILPKHYTGHTFIRTDMRTDIRTELFVHRFWCIKSILRPDTDDQTFCEFIVPI